MAKHPLLLLLAVWVLAGELWLEAKAQEESDEVKLCGRELVRTIIRNCGNIHWRRSDNLAHEAKGDAFPDTDPYADSQLEEAVGSSDWLVLTKAPQALCGSLRGTREDPDEGSLLNRCCNRGCTKRELTIFC